LSPQKTSASPPSSLHETSSVSPAFRLTWRMVRSGTSSSPTEPLAVTVGVGTSGGLWHALALANTVVRITRPKPTCRIHASFTRFVSEDHYRRTCPATQPASDAGKVYRRRLVATRLAATLLADGAPCFFVWACPALVIKRDCSYISIHFSLEIAEISLPIASSGKSSGDSK